MCCFKGISAPQRAKRRVQAMENQQPNSPQILHHRQRLQFCLLHALNNLFQGDATFTRCELNDIARRLWEEDVLQEKGSFSCLFNSHYNIVTGNYDVNVLLRALQAKGPYAIKWCDQRKGATAIDLNEPNLIGFILYHPTENYFGIGHWSALKNIGGVWYDLDSSLEKPMRIGEGDKAVKRFMDQCCVAGSQALLVSSS